MKSPLPGLLLGLALLAAAAAAGAGQVRVAGRVVDAVTASPVAGALVTAQEADGRVISRIETREDGTFAFLLDTRALVGIDARRIGYRVTTLPLLHVDGRDFIPVDVRMEPDAIRLAPLEVVASPRGRPSGFLAGFRERRRTGVGTYVTREEIEARGPTYVADIFRSISGLRVEGDGWGSRSTASVARAGGREGCQALVYIDGVPMNRRPGTLRAVPVTFHLDGLLSPGDVEGIEIYRGVGSVPIEFLTPDADCGVILVWTRRGERQD
jgi:hypothetical protein